VSFARIHWQNLTNFGVLTLEFADPHDYRRVQQGDVLVLERIRDTLGTDTDPNDSAEAQLLKEQLGKAGINADIQQFDQATLINKALTGSIDVLLNIAGYADPQSLLDTDADNIVKTYTINVFAMLLLIREAVRYMYDRPAKILNVASTAGITSRPGWLAYASSKAAVVSLSATLADELAGSGIKVYSISPGRTATELRRKLAPEEDPTSIMQPGQVADVIA